MIPFEHLRPYKALWVLLQEAHAERLFMDNEVGGARGPPESLKGFPCKWAATELVPMFPATVPNSLRLLGRFLCHLQRRHRQGSDVL